MENLTKALYTREEVQTLIDDAVKAYNAQKMREWRAKQTPEERKARRQRYALNALKRAGMLDNLTD